MNGHSRVDLTTQTLRVTDASTEQPVHEQPASHTSFFAAVRGSVKVKSTG